MRTIASFSPQPAAGNEDSDVIRREESPHRCPDSLPKTSSVSAQQSCVSFRDALTPDK